MAPIKVSRTIHRHHNRLPLFLVLIRLKNCLCIFISKMGLVGEYNCLIYAITMNVYLQYKYTLLVYKIVYKYNHI